MQLHNRKWAVISIVALASIILAACAPQTVEVPVTVIVEGTPVVQVQEVTPTPQPVDKTLIVCQGQEPDSLYGLGTDMLASANIQEAFRDGPIDAATYAYQPVILDKLPSLKDGDAALTSVEITDGAFPTANSNGDVVTATAGTEYWTLDANGDLAKATFDGTPLKVVQLSATFKIKDGITWQDGEPLTADDSVFGYELTMNPDTPTSKFGTDRTASYVANDASSTTWTGIPGWVDSTYYINFYGPYARHAYGTISAAEMLTNEEVTRKPLGWGAFKVDEWVAGDHLTLSRNENYFRAGEGLPYFDTVIWKFVPDTNQALAQLLAGQCDMGTQDLAFDGQGPLLVQAEAQGVLKPYFVTGTTWEHIDFGIVSAPDYKRAAGADLFQDVNIRHAFAYCIDRQSLVDNFLYGRSTVINSYIPAEHPLYAGDALTTYPFDAEKGKGLLEAAGWKDSDGDGIRDKGGVKLSVEYASTTADLRKNKVMPAVQAMLKDCGVDVTINAMPASKWFASGKDTPLRGRRYDLGEFAWLTGVEPGCDLYITANISNDSNGWGGNNNPGYSNAAYDSACQGQLSTLDPDKKKAFAIEAQKIFSEDLPVIPLFLRLKLAVTRPELVGVVVDPTQNTEMFKIEEFRIDESMMAP